LILFLIFLVGVPLLELYFLIRVGAEIGVFPTIGISLLTATLGGFLVRKQGLGVLARVQRMKGAGEVPALAVLDGALLLIAGIFLLLPGFLTDALGFLLLIPASRRYLLQCFVTSQLSGQKSGPLPGPRIIEGEYRREQD